MAMRDMLRGGVGGQPRQAAAFIALFSAGMLTAAMGPFIKTIDLRCVWASLASVALILTVLAGYSTAYAAAPIALLDAAFFLIANGNAPFGLLESRAAKRLGDVIFGIYLLQGLVLAGVFGSVQARAFALASPIAHWRLIAIDGVLLTMVATGAHVWIKGPRIGLGRLILEFSSRGRPERTRSV